MNMVAIGVMLAAGILKGVPEPELTIQVNEPELHYEAQICVLSNDSFIAEEIITQTQKDSGNKREPCESA